MTAFHILAAVTFSLQKDKMAIFSIFLVRHMRICCEIDMLSIMVRLLSCKGSCYHTHLHIYYTYKGLFSTNACLVGKEAVVNRMPNNIQ